MNFRISPQTRGACLAASAMLMLTACSSAVPPQVAGALSAPPPAGSIAFDPPSVPDGQQAEVLRAFTTALEAALKARGVTRAEGSDWHLTIALSQAPSSIGVTQQRDGSRFTVKWRAEPRKHLILEKCQAQRLRVVLVGRVDGREGAGFHGQGSFEDCQPTPAAIDRLAQEFARLLTRG